MDTCRKIKKPKKIKKTKKNQKNQKNQKKLLANSKSFRATLEPNAGI